jgi:hypothetical protein
MLKMQSHDGVLLYIGEAWRQESGDGGKKSGKKEEKKQERETRVSFLLNNFREKPNFSRFYVQVNRRFP